LFHHRQKIATVSKPRRTPSTGLETANQKQKSQAGSLAVGFVFMLFLKRSKIDISQNMKFFWDACSAVGAIRIDAWRVRYPAQNT
jgi:hypothetical protein